MCAYVIIMFDHSDCSNSDSVFTRTCVLGAHVGRGDKCPEFKDIAPEFQFFFRGGPRIPPPLLATYGRCGRQPLSCLQTKWAAAPGLYCRHGESMPTYLHTYIAGVHGPIDYSRYPSEVVQRVWITYYLEARAKLRGAAF